MKSDRYGLHRVLEPKGVLPQAAQRLDNDSSRAFDNEIVIDVERLNVDSASFVQMEAGATSDDAKREQVRRLIGETVAARGKQHNPVTGSGGMLLGRVAQMGTALRNGPHASLQVGERIATLVSLSLTPLSLSSIDEVDLRRHQVRVAGKAILFETGAWSRLPASLPESVALAALDVAGAAPQVTRLVGRLVERGLVPVVAVLGCGGKSGLLCSAAARRAGARVVGIERSEEAAAGARRLGAAEVAVADAADALAVADAVIALAGGTVDLTVSCVNVPNAEMGAILATSDGGTIYFFSMATSFTKAALGAEGVSRDVDMLVGNGYAPGHAQATLALIEADPVLRQIFLERFGDG